MCSCWGDPHCSSYDGRKFTIGGPCYYTLASIKLGDFEVNVEVNYQAILPRFRIKTLLITLRQNQNNVDKIEVGVNDGINPIDIKVSTNILFILK